MLAILVNIAALFESIDFSKSVTLRTLFLHKVSLYQVPWTDN
jgi:hypothetical protein